MKKPFDFVGLLLMIIIGTYELLEFLVIPALFVVIGLLCDLPWQYYAVSIGGYVALHVLIEILLFFIFKAVDQKYTPRIERKLERICDRFSKKDTTSD